MAALPRIRLPTQSAFPDRFAFVFLALSHSSPSAPPFGFRRFRCCTDSGSDTSISSLSNIVGGGCLRSSYTTTFSRCRPESTETERLFLRFSIGWYTRRSSHSSTRTPLFLFPCAGSRHERFDPSVWSLPNLPMISRALPKLVMLCGKWVRCPAAASAVCYVGNTIKSGACGRCECVNVHNKKGKPRD